VHWFTHNKNLLYTPQTREMSTGL